MNADRSTTSPRKKKELYDMEISRISLLQLKFKAKSALKVMATVLSDRNGLLLVDFVDRGETINTDNYILTNYRKLFVKKYWNADLK